MEFGKVDTAELSKINFRLPADPPETTAVLKAAKKKGVTRFYVGCAKWGRKDWIGRLYPEGTKEKDFLQQYATMFNSIEFNAVGYKLPTKEQVLNWKHSAGDGFLFCPKFTNLITHIKRLKNTHEDVSRYLDVMHEFGDKLGPIFLLPQPQMSLKDFDTIEAFIKDLPADVSVFLELRHEEWFKEGYNAQMYKLLKKLKRGTVITDTAGRRDCVHMRLSTAECFIRFVGNSLHKSDYTRIDDWVQRIKVWMKEGLKTCYFFMHQEEEIHSPELIRYFIEQLNQHCGTDIVPPVVKKVKTRKAISSKAARKVIEPARKISANAANTAGPKVNTKVAATGKARIGKKPIS